MPEIRYLRATTLPTRIPRRPLPRYCCDPECHELTVEGKRFCGPHLERLHVIRDELERMGDWKVTFRDRVEEAA